MFQIIKMNRFSSKNRISFLFIFDSKLGSNCMFIGTQFFTVFNNINTILHNFHYVSFECMGNVRKKQQLYILQLCKQLTLWHMNIVTKESKIFQIVCKPFKNNNAILIMADVLTCKHTYILTNEVNYKSILRH